jgi:hypothetical protein
LLYRTDRSATTSSSTIDLAEMHRKSDDAAVLNRAGAEGWELVSVTLRNIAYLKRPQLSKPANRTKSVP